MKPTIAIQQEEKWTMSFREFVGSFLYILLYFIIIETYTGPSNPKKLLIGASVLSIVYFAIGWYFKPHASVHLLPVVSFIKLLDNNNLKCFFLRTGGQLIGAFFATFTYLLATGGGTKEYNLVPDPSHPFLTALFTGILGVMIYFIYLFVLRGQKNSSYSRFLLFSIGLGVIFYLTYFLESITLLNPFGLLPHYLLPNPTFTITEILVGLTVHVLVPMLFISGTHFYINGFLKVVFKKTDIERII